MINKKDINMIVEEIINCENDISRIRDYDMMDGKRLKEVKRRKDCATKILTTLESDEIILAKGKVQNFNGEYWIGDNSEYSIMVKIKDLEGKTVILRAVIKE